MPFCSQCGIEITATAKFCPSCGITIGSTSAPVLSSITFQVPKISSQKRKTIIWVVSGAVAVLLAYIYTTPYLVVSQFKSAVESKKYRELRESIDFDALRMSLKGTVRDGLQKVADEQAEAFPESKGAGSAFAGFAAKGVDEAVDKFVKPESLLDLQSSTKTLEDLLQGVSKENQDVDVVMKKITDAITISTGYSGLNHFEVRFSAPNAGTAKLIFSRQGLTSWKLTDAEIGEVFPYVFRKIGLTKSEAEMARAAALRADYPGVLKWEQNAVALGEPRGYGPIVKFFSVRYPDVEFVQSLEDLVLVEESVRRAVLIARCGKIYASENRLANQSYFNLVREVAVKMNFDHSRPRPNGLFYPDLTWHLPAAVIAYHKADVATKSAWRSYLQSGEAKDGFKWTVRMQVLSGFLDGNSGFIDVNTGKVFALWEKWLLEFLQKAELLEQFVKAADESRPGLGQKFSRFATTTGAPADVATYRSQLDEMFSEFKSGKDDITRRIWKTLPKEAAQAAAQWVANPMVKEMESLYERIGGAFVGALQNKPSNDVEIDPFRLSVDTARQMQTPEVAKRSVPNCSSLR